MAEDPLLPAREALERGDYSGVMRFLEPLNQQFPLTHPLGAEIMLMMATALMGQGETRRAADCCRRLLASGDLERRSQARDLLMVLEAPPLRRPRHWSVTIPQLTGRDIFPDHPRAGTRQGRSQDRPSPPPVGPTRGPVGFALLVVLLVALLGLLAGCMEVRTDLHLVGPGRAHLTHHLRTSSGQPNPWQRRFEKALLSDSFRLRQDGQERILETGVLPSHEALAALGRSLEAAAELGGVPVPPPRLRLDEQNWLVGVRQWIVLEIDLHEMPTLPGVDLAIRIGPVSSGAVRQAEPLPAHSVKDPADSPEPGSFTHAIVWKLQPGQINHLELRGWRWSVLGLGGVGIALLLALTLGLQHVRHHLGYGLPELPA